MKPHKTVTMYMPDPLGLGDSEEELQIDAGIAELIAEFWRMNFDTFRSCEANDPVGLGRKFLWVEFELYVLDGLLNILAKDPHLEKLILNATSVFVSEAAGRDLFLDIDIEIDEEGILTSAGLRFTPELLPRVMACLAAKKNDHSFEGSNGPDRPCQPHLQHRPVRLGRHEAPVAEPYKRPPAHQARWHDDARLGRADRSERQRLDRYVDDPRQTEGYPHDRRNWTAPSCALRRRKPSAGFGSDGDA